MLFQKRATKNSGSFYARSRQHGARKDHVGRRRACFENSIKMMSIVA